MKTLKHIGRIKNTGAKIVVAFRTLPGDSASALVLGANTLNDSYHDALMTLLETDQAQDAFEFGEMLHIRMFPDGRPMLKALQQDGRLQKVATDNVIMTPSNNSEIPLSELNVLIAEQRNCSIDDLCNFVAGAPPKTTTKKSEPAKVESETATPLVAPEGAVLSDGDIAKNYRSQADAMYKEAARLRKQADELDPPKKKVTKAAETESA
jgi:hypothetical protein